VPKSFDFVVELSGIIYDDVATEKVDAINLKRNFSSFSKLIVKGDFGKRIKKARVEDSDSCRKCGRRHSGECRLGSNLCFRFGKTEHYSYDFPNGQKCYNCDGIGNLAKDCRRPMQD
jgi:hypothetical protein